MYNVGKAKVKTEISPVGGETASQLSQLHLTIKLCLFSLLESATLLLFCNAGI